MFSWIVGVLALALAIAGFFAAVAVDRIDVSHHLWGTPRKDGKDAFQETPAIPTARAGEAMRTVPHSQPD
ncbi:MAG TPA: hypothetical protein VMF32_24190 [Xanthobacteraceae bacterium]|nr:hypothetical protein [Xanthobacteraceae bacterium]